MKVKKMLLGILLALFLLGVPQLISTAAAGTWECNFEDPADADLWAPNDEGPRTGESEWKIEDGWFHQTKLETMYHKAAGGDPDWTDYTVEFDMTIEEGACAGVLLRSDSTASNGYRLWLRSGLLQLMQWVDDAWQDPRVDVPFNMELGKEYHMEVSIEGWIIDVWVDGEHLIEGHKLEGELFESGMLGLINYDCHTRYDNIKVSGPNVKSMPVEAWGKLSTVWGQIKRGKLD